MAEARAPAGAAVVLDLEWQGGLRFGGRCGDAELTMDSPPGPDAPSPVQTLAFALAGCMAMDVAVVIAKSRIDLHDREALMGPMSGVTMSGVRS